MTNSLFYGFFHRFCRRTLGRFLSCVLVLPAAFGACGGAAPPPSADATDATGGPTAETPGPQKVCEHLHSVISQELSTAGRGGHEGKEQEFIRECLEEESAGRADGEKRWAGRAACFLAAKTGDDVLACEESHPFPSVPLDCDRLLTPEDIQADLGISMRPSVDDEEPPSTENNCSRDFHAEDGRFVMVYLRSHRTATEATAMVRRPHEQATQVKLLSGLGDAAQRLVTDSLCNVAVAKGRVTMVVTLNARQQACAFDALERLAAKATARLP
ncbi:hypothetical protein [Polyangium jinanense]|uniref:Uncharacterized protein n=1 Tax=Polyangium jinanense TaxID=2829994 RepID=A0A9X3XH87_9BACT|nr:hypothetical protein [Polyangium jinanense]MDC3958054.1 hypothetical protein [Polyangium jinanense]MDC3989320.1 hypothetical protein [Polyangium jinanense]